MAVNGAVFVALEGPGIKCLVPDDDRAPAEAVQEMASLLRAAATPGPSAGLARMREAFEERLARTAPPSGGTTGPSVAAPAHKVLLVGTVMAHPEDIGAPENTDAMSEQGAEGEEFFKVTIKGRKAGGDGKNFITAKRPRAHAAGGTAVPAGPEEEKQPEAEA